MIMLDRISKTAFLSAWASFGAITACKVDRIALRVRDTMEK